MTNEITVPQKCILMRNGVEIWVDDKKAVEIGEDWRNGMKAAIKVEGRFLNTVDITGIFNPRDIEEMKRRRNGEIICRYGNWHPRGQECLCHLSKRENKFPEYPDISNEKREENSKRFRGMKEKIFKKEDK